ncbi:unnamed protein product [Fusarium equiseti]|uniref:Uncharacterized protein n=1 Tax=Fusarium equiseti TaxID=61235 RepID=A0A8J2NLK7_FUSEQ|nr:unnamed protein product [Fusarium equiseti]
MSASHLSQLGNNGSEPLTFQTEAISHIAKGIAEIDSGSLIKDELLLGIILLGMTTSWHDPSSLGLCHFHGARQLFRIWVAQNDMTQLQLPMAYTHRLIVSSMVYWEVMAACLIDQDIDAFSYLGILSTQPQIFFSYPCPWTGIGMGVLIDLAKCLALVRRHRTSPDSTLLDKALVLMQGLETTHIPTLDEIQGTGDLFTPAHHLYKIALCHRLIAKLELYRSFPELRQVSFQGATQIDHAQETQELAIGILKMMETIPENSRTIAIQTLILLSAGSSLGYHSSPAREIITDWRRLQTINQAAAILKEVWLRMDSMVPGCESPIAQVHWMNVMVDNKLETILG